MSDTRILIVEDHLSWQPILKKRVRRALDNMGITGQIHFCSTFETAWEALENDGPWKLLITDIGLGEDRHISSQKFGIHLVDQARELHIPCIVVSGTPVVTNYDVRDLLLERDVKDFFSKPKFETDRFIKTVEKILTQTGTEPYLYEVNLNQLRDQINQHFNESELQSLCFQLQVEYASLPAIGKLNKIEEFILYLVRRNRLPDLLEMCKQERPHLNWHI